MSKSIRMTPLFLRNEFTGCSKWGIPLVKKQWIDLNNISLIACSDTRLNDSAGNRRKGVHFFVDDYRFNGVYRNPGKSLIKFSQYAFLLTLDFSTYADMQPWRQLESVAHNRWCGAYWQANGLIVIPTISWSTPGSYEYCFDGVEQNAIVAISTIGCKRHNKRNFLHGYNAMLAKLHPLAIICFGQPFAEMSGKVIIVDYIATRRVMH